jgi:hypothetical protein
VSGCVFLRETNDRRVKRLASAASFMLEGLNAKGLAGAAGG